MKIILLSLNRKFVLTVFMNFDIYIVYQLMFDLHIIFRIIFNRVFQYEVTNKLFALLFVRYE